MALVGERIRCVVRVRPIGEDGRADERSCVEVRGDELLILPVVSQDGAGAAGAACQSPSRPPMPRAGAADRSPSRPSTPRAGATGLAGEPPRTPTSARRAPSTPQPRTPLGRTPGGGGGSFRAPPLDGSVAKSYGFDVVLPPSATQEQVWAECAPFIDAPIEGYNACIFAYGQTGSGKTYTMLGTAEEPGVIRRACDHLFAAVDARPECEFHISVSYVELYNNEFKDLLCPDNQPGRKRALPIELEAARKRRPIALHELPTAAGQPPSVYLAGSETLRTPVRSAAELLDLVVYGAAARSTGTTKLNALSSRSHAVLTLHVESREPGSSSARVGKVHLVDLAGSENLTQSGATGSTQLEAQAINASLSALADVLEALSKRGAQPSAGPCVSPRREGGAAGRGGATAIPYRNHKLTRLLADSIGGNSKTLMLTTILPFASCHRQTTMAAHFAARARAIRPQAALVPHTDVASAGALAKLQAEIGLLRARLAQRDEEIEMIEKTSMARDSAQAEESARALRQLEAAKRREEATLRQQMAEVIHLRSVDKAEAEHRDAQAKLAMAMRDAEANARERELCTHLEQLEQLQDMVEAQQAELHARAGEVAQLRAQSDAARRQVEEDTAALGKALSSWETDHKLLEQATERLRAAEAERDSLRAQLSAGQQEGQGAIAAAAKEVAMAKAQAEKAAANADKAAATAAKAAAKALRAAQDDAAAAIAREAHAHKALADLQAELDSARAELATASKALGTATKSAAADEPTKGQKKQLAELNAELSKARAEAKAARAAVAAAENDAADARDARDARLAAEGTLRRRVALLEARLRQGQAGFAELSACVAEARALPALQTRLRGLVATTRLLTAPLPAVDSAALGAAMSTAADEAEREPSRPEPLSRPTSPPAARPAPSESRSAGVSSLLGIRGADQDARIAQTLDGLRKGSAAGGTMPPLAALAEKRARSSKRSDRTSATPRGASDDEDDGNASGNASERERRAEAEQDAPAPVPEAAAAGRPSRRVAKRTYTPEEHADEEEADVSVPQKKRGGAVAAKRGRNQAQQDELVTQQPLVTVTGSRNKRTAAPNPKETASELRVAPDKENGAQSEVPESTKRRALFNPRRRASHAFSAMI